MTWNPAADAYAAHDPLRLAGHRAAWVRDYREIRAGYAARQRDNGHTFAVATDLGAMTDWTGHRGQSPEARVAGAVVRSRHFHRALACRWTKPHGRAVQWTYDDARSAAETAWEEAIALS